MDHVGPANVVLSALPLLKSEALLFTATLLYKSFADTVEEFLSKCFGFDCKLLPVILGARCINHEGAGYASPVMVQPIPVEIYHFTKHQQQQRVLIWERITAHPFVIPKLPASICDALCDSVAELTFPFIQSSPRAGVQVLNSNNIETAIHMLLKLSSTESSDYHFWESLCTALKQRLKPFLSGLQTQALLHNLHIHLTVTEIHCPICRHIPSSEYMGLFCAEVPLPLYIPTPCFMALIHNYSTSDSRYLCSEARSGRGVHIIDCIDGSVDGDTLKLKFFAPLAFVIQNFNVTVAITHMRGSNIITTILPTTSIESMLIEFKEYRFSQTATDLCETISCRSKFGDLISHVYSQDSVQSEIALSDSTLEVLASSNLSTKKISSSEIQLSCGAFRFNLKFNFPIDYDHVNIKQSKTQKNVRIISPRQPQSFEEEKPFFIAYPDHQLSLLPQDYISENQSHFGMQMTPEEKEVIELDRDSMDPLTKVKETLFVFFKRKDEYHFHLTPYDGKRVLGRVLVNKRAFDYQHNAPAVDLAFYFNDYPVRSVFDAWSSMIQGMTVTSIFVDDVEYEELKKVVHYLARRTNGDLKSAGRNSRYYDLIKGGADKYFTRAVFYFLYCDPDQTAISVKEDCKCTNCDKFCPNTIKCRGCKSAQYCSDNCRSRHWPKHSRVCKLATESEAVSGIPGDSCSPSNEHQKKTCSLCSNSGILKKCLRCGEAQYCDKDCQTKHWPQHKAECGRLTKALEQESSAAAKMLPIQPEASMHCAYCNTSSMALKLCTGCGKVKYCGTECQRKDRKDHKVTCN